MNWGRILFGRMIVDRLRPFVEGLTEDAVECSLWNGVIEIKDLQLKKEVLNGLPIKFKTGYVGSVKVQNLWRSLQSEPVKVDLDRIFLLAEPDTSVEGTRNERVPEKIIRSQADNSRSSKDSSDESNSTGLLASAIRTLVGNLTITITNVHIRFEDEESNVGHPFVLGLTLAKLVAVTVDGNDEETFVTGSALDCVQKSGKFKKLSFYFDTDTKPWLIPKSWADFKEQDWNMVFLPEINGGPSSYKGEKPAFMEDCNYVLKSVDGTVGFIKLGQKDSRSPDEPAQKVIAKLDDFEINVTEEQCRDALKLAETLSKFSCAAVAEDQKKARGGGDGSYSGNEVSLDDDCVEEGKPCPMAPGKDRLDVPYTLIEVQTKVVTKQLLASGRSIMVTTEGLKIGIKLYPGTKRFNLGLNSYKICTPGLLGEFFLNDQPDVNDAEAEFYDAEAEFYDADAEFSDDCYEKEVEENDQGQEGSGSSAEKPYTTIKVEVGIDLVKLGLFIGGTRNASLATVQVIGVCASYEANNNEELGVMASLERFSLKDEREGTDPEMQYMIEDGDDQAPNMLDGDASHAQRNKTKRNENDTVVRASSTSHGWGQSLKNLLVINAKLCSTQNEFFLRIQRPRIVVAPDFLLAVYDYLLAVYVASMHAKEKAFRDDEVSMERTPEESDTSSTMPPHVEEKNGNKKEEAQKPPVKYRFDLQAIGPELTFYDSINGPSEAPVLPERHLRATLNVVAGFSMEGDNMELKAKLNGLTVESTSGVNVLEPVNASVTCSQVTGKQDIHASITEIDTKFSYSILQLMLRLHDNARASFVQPRRFGSSSPQSALGLADLRTQSQPDNLTVVVKVEVKRVSATVYDDFIGLLAPGLLKLSIAPVKATFHRDMKTSVDIDFPLTFATYNSKFHVWEPLIETCDLRCEYESDPRDKVQILVETRSDFNVNITVPNVNMMLKIYLDWMNLDNIEASSKKQKLQGKCSSSVNLNRRLSRFSTDLPMDGEGANSLQLMTHNEIGEALWLRTSDGSGKFRVSPLPSNGSVIVKIEFPVTRCIQDSSHTQMAQGRSGVFLASRIEDAEVSADLKYEDGEVATHFFAVSGGEDADEESEGIEPQQSNGSQKFGAIEVSSSRNGPWSSVRLNYGLGPAHWQFGIDHLASEMFVHNGVKHLFVRTLVTLTNETEYHLEARLYPVFLVGHETEENGSNVISLGTLKPNSTVACPIESLRRDGPDYIVQLKPCVGSVKDGVAHNWSLVASYREKTEAPGGGRQPSKELRIRGLQNTDGALLSCPALASSSSHNEDFWLSIQCKATEVGKSSKLVPIEDKRLVISAPLKLANFLSVACEYRVSEKDSEKGLVELQTGLIEPGESKALYLADLENHLYLKLIPAQGGWKYKGSDVLISRSRRKQAKELIVTNGVRDLAIRMQYQYDDGGLNKKVSARVIRLYVLCWVDRGSCPLRFKLVGKHRRYHTKVTERIEEEDKQTSYPTMISNYNCKTMTLAVALPGSEFGSVTPLGLLDDPDGKVFLPGADNKNSCFGFLATITSHPLGFARTKVIRLRPYTLDEQERRAEAPSQMKTIVKLPKIGVSIIDQQPQELVFLSLKKVEVIYATGQDEKGVRFEASVGYLQADNQLPPTGKQTITMPVLLAPERVGGEVDVIKFIATMKAEANEAVQVCSNLDLKVTQSPWRINFDELLFWAFVEMKKNLHLDQLELNSEEVDSRIRIKTFDISAVRIKVSLKSSPEQCPEAELAGNWVWMARFFQLVNIDRLLITFKAKHFSEKELQAGVSCLLEADHVKVPFWLLGSVDSPRVLHRLSRVLKKLSKHHHNHSNNQNVNTFLQELASNDVIGVGDGFVIGVKHLGRSLKSGAKEAVIIIKGAQENGSAEFLQGIGKGIAVFASSTTVGALEAAAVAAAGTRNTWRKEVSGKLRPNKYCYRRSRPPRAFKEPGILIPYEPAHRDGNGMSDRTMDAEEVLLGSNLPGSESDLDKGGVLDSPDGENESLLASDGYQDLNFCLNL